MLCIYLAGGKMNSKVVSIAISVITIAIACPPALAAQPPTLCTRQEVPVISCLLNNKKTVSLCASKDLDASRGYMQYRLGTNSSLIELKFPKEKIHPKTNFKTESQGISHGGMTAYSFHKGAYRYSIFDTSTPAGESAGVIVNRQGKRVAFLKCNGDVYREYVAGESSIPDAGDDIDFISTEEVMTNGPP
jgi:hypothetical protein